MRGALIAAGAALALAACQPAPQPETPASPIPPAPAVVLADDLGMTPTGAALQSTLLGTINGCRIYRLAIDGRSYVLASAYVGDVSASSHVRTCDLEPAR